MRSRGGAPGLVVFLLPTKEQISARYFEEATGAFGIHPDDLDMRRPNTFLAELASELDLDLVDLLPAFQQATEPVYFEYDEHLTPHGHQVLAHELATYLGVSGPVLVSTHPIGDRYPVTRDGRLLSFQSVRHGNSELFIHDLATKETRRLTVNDVDEAHPMLTLDGKRILFTEGDAGTFDTHVVIMDVDGRHRRRILPDPDTRSAIGVFSPDDTLIAYAHWHQDPESTPRISILDLLTGERHFLTDPGVEAWRPVFSPDGTRVAFIAKHDGQFDVFLHELGASTTQRLTRTPYDEWDPSFSPDGGTIAYAAHADGNWDLFQYSVSDGTTRQVTRTRGDEWDPSYTPTGDLLYAGTFGFFAGILQHQAD
jgi:Tol biopolymer transport system component